MVGGVGSRLWPLSREDNPKQFHSLSGERSMLVKTIQRMAARAEGPGSVFLVAAERHAERIDISILQVCEVSKADAAYLSRWAATRRRQSPSRRRRQWRNLATRWSWWCRPIMKSPLKADFWQDGRSGVPAALAGKVVVFGIVPTGPGDRVRLYRSRRTGGGARAELQVTAFCRKAGL